MAAVKKVKDVDKGYKRLMVRAKDLARVAPVRVGVHPDEGQQHYADGVSVIDVAIWNEFGTETIPERSFIRAWFDLNRDKVKLSIERMMQAVMAGKYTKDQALNLLGLRWVAEVQKRMSEGIPPPNAPSTIAKKGSDKPLIDTGQLRSSIKHTIGKGRR